MKIFIIGINDMERKLVTIRKVKELKSIPEATFIELALVDGWQCVVKKGEFKPNDYGVYFEIDSFLPIDKRYEFLRSRSFKKLENGQEGFRLKTSRFMGEISQGLLLPLSIFPEINLEEDKEKDLSNKLNVIKYELPIPTCLGGSVKGLRPCFVHKTDQERIQNLEFYFEKYKDIEFEETEKLDGSSCSYYYNDSQFGVCSRNLEIKESEKNSFWIVARKLNIEDRLRRLNKNIVLQGELCGPGIQKNKMNLSEIDFFLFDIYDIDKDQYMLPEERVSILNVLNEIDEMKIKHVPIINKVRIFNECNDVNSLLKRVEGKMFFNKKHEREGCVYKSCERLYRNRIVSFKCINNLYLI